MKTRIILGILIILNCITIFYFSNQVADNSSKQSSRIVEIVANLIPGIKNMEEPEKSHFKEEILTKTVRKAAHFSIYATLGILTISFMYTYEKFLLKQKMTLNMLFCILYAEIDEIHQFFIQGRSCELRDVIIDSLRSTNRNIACNCYI